jgi:hypothetical protein
MDPSAQEFLDATASVPETLGATASDNPVAEVPLAPGVTLVAGALTAEALEMTFGTAFELIAARVGSPEGDYWRLQDGEKKGLAQAWLPVLSPLWAKWCTNLDPGLALALGMTAMTLGPRLVRANASRASQTANTATAKSGASSSSPDQPAPANPPKQIDLSVMPADV